MDSAKGSIRHTLDEIRALLAGGSLRHLSEADTKANFIEPIISALGWKGIGVVTREYHVKNSGEFIDYVMSGTKGPLLAVEAKALHVGLTEKNAAQLVQYCSIEGIEWAALTNGRELRLFNTFLKPDLGAKRVFDLDLLAYADDVTFDLVFDRAWLLSRDSITSGTTAAWLDQWRLDKEVRSLLLDPESSVIRQLRTSLADADLRVPPQVLTDWFRSRLDGVVNPLLFLPRPEIAVPVVDQSSEQKASDTPDDTAKPGGGTESNRYYGVTLRELMEAGLIPVGAKLSLFAGRNVVATATLRDDGQIACNGHVYRSLSDKAFAPLLGPTRISLNGWTHWYAQSESGSESLASIRQRYLQLKATT